MKWTGWTATLLTLGAASLSVVAISCSSGTATDEPVAKIDPLERGETVAYTSGCIDCHTPGTFYGEPDLTRQLSGSELGWKGPWGVSYPRNLTPDMETGIGSWSEDEIVNAIRTGTAPGGRQLLPPMPWPMYAHLSDDDAYALAAYLKSLPPVKHQVPSVLPPGAQPAGAYLEIPPPPAWDAQNLTPPDADSGSSGH